MRTPRNTLDDFLDLSVLLTGFHRSELEGTGLAKAYHDELLDVLGEPLAGGLLGIIRRIRERSDGPAASPQQEAAVQREVLDSATWGPVARNIIQMWYLGQWSQLPQAWRNVQGATPSDTDRVISAAAYQEGLLWGDAGTHPPGAKQPGFGSWALPPRVHGESPAAPPAVKRMSRKDA